MGASLYPPPVEAPVTTTTGLIAATDFAVVSFYGSKINGVCMVHCYLTYSPNPTTNTIAPSAGTANLTDTQVATLPDGYRPPTTINFIWGDGAESGEGYVTSAGAVWIRTTDYNQAIVNGKNLRITATFTL